LAALLGLFGQEGSGVHYLGNSQLGYESPFATSCKTVSKVVTDFSDFDTVLVQGGNPAESMPDSLRVCKELDGVENLIYFGLYENETSKRASIVIPAKNFFEKEDVILAYGHQHVHKLNTMVESDIGISEYDFTQKMFTLLGFDGLESEEAYINAWLVQCEEGEHGYVSPAHEEVPYSEGFGEDGDDEFEFIEDYDDDFINTKSLNKVRTSKKNQLTDERLWLLTPKTNKALNTQFKRDNKVYLHPTLGYEEGAEVKVVSECGEVVLDVVLSEDVRHNCLVVPSNTIGVNMLTPSLVSNEGESACYQEVKVTVEKVEG
jgi:anaerobic selenocysteine-containing dehydrogenase